MSGDLGVAGCSGCERLQRQLRAAQDEVHRLQAALEEARRSGKRQAAPFSKGAPKATPKKPGRKAGPAYGRASRRAVPSHVDEILEAPLPRQCPGCRGHVVEEGVAAQYQTEIPEVKPHVRRFDVHVGRCESCGRRVQGRHALQTSDALGAACSQLGPRAVAFSAWLHQELGLPYGKASAVMDRACGIEVTSGGLAQAESRLARRAELSYADLLKSVRQSPAVYPDETSARMCGQRWWLWVFVSTMTVVYVQRPSRGSDVVEEVLGADFSRLLGHDGWAPYDQLTEATHQQCLAHLIRRSKALLETATRGAVRFPRKVKRLLQDALDLRDRFERGELTERGFSRVRSQLEKRLGRVLEMTLTHEGNRKFQDHLAHHADDLFTFLYEEIEATNWPAEQAIRPAVRFRKTSGGHRSPGGARTRDVLLSILGTARKRGLDPLIFFVHLLRSTKPVLLPAAEGP